MVHDVGIVIKSFLPCKHKLSVLSLNSGKVNLVFSKRDGRQIFSPGVIIAFSCVGNGSQAFFVKKMEILHVPIEPIRDHLNWIHHLLEICYYFLPLHATCTDVFRLLQYSLVSGGKSSVFEPYFYVVQRVCLVRLLVLIGFYPPDGLLYVLGLFDDVVRVSLDSSDAQKVRSLQKLLEGVSAQKVQEIDRWVLKNLREHSHRAQFKTLSFFYSEK